MISINLIFFSRVYLNTIHLGGNDMNAVVTSFSAVTIGVVIVISVVVIGVACISVLLYHKRKNQRRNDGYPGNTIYYLTKIYIANETSN